MKKAGWKRFFQATLNIFKFNFFLVGRATRTRLFLLLTAIPVVIAVFVRLFFSRRIDDVVAVFNEILMVFFIQFLIVILAVFYGTSIAAEEVENKTLPYLLTRPLSRRAVLIGKYFAYVIFLTVGTLSSLVVSYFVMHSRALGQPAFFSRLLTSCSAVFLGILAYTAFFSLLGSFLKRALIIGLIFGFGWENVIQYFPGATQRFSVAHYLKSLLPYRPEAGKFSFLTFRLEPTSPALSVIALLLISVVALGLATLIFSLKEYRFDDTRNMS